tara:strand:+ start:58474 stop:58899 length:426 start_codon:yes stop_codon:yes gene_type:complete
MVFNIFKQLEKQYAWSKRTFGPGERTAGVIDHIQEELQEIAAKPDDLEEWADLLLLSFDGAMRMGFKPAQIMKAMRLKQVKNEGRNWPDWRTAEPGKAINHIREPDADENFALKPVALKCEHGRGPNEYCAPCGRTHGRDS